MYYKLHRAILSGIAAAIAWTPAIAERVETTINDGWEFKMPDAAHWERVNVPHTYNIDAYFGRNYYQGKGFYRRRLDIKAPQPGKRYYLKFEAVSKAADITVNGQNAGSHNGGYSTFIIDITDKVSDSNIIEVAVDNSRRDITPISADFTFWGGIYRDVWLVTTNEQHFNMSNYGSDGIFITTPTVNDKEATVAIRSEVTNDSKHQATMEVQNIIYNPDGSVFQTLSETKKLKPGETATFSQQSKKINNPALWSPESPTLYSVKTRLIDPKTKQTLDERLNRTARLFHLRFGLIPGKCVIL